MDADGTAQLSINVNTEYPDVGRVVIDIADLTSL
jgi:hypothetical protein